MKKLLLITLIALLAVPAISGPLRQEMIPVMMIINKTIEIAIDDPQDPTDDYILLHRQLDGSGLPTDDFEGSVVVSMVNNFPVTVTATINPTGSGLALTSEWFTDVAPYNEILTYANPVEVASFPAAPNPGQQFWIGAFAGNVNIAMWPSGTIEQEVAQVLLTVSDAL